MGRDVFVGGIGFHYHNYGSHIIDRAVKVNPNNGKEESKLEKNPVP